MNISLSWEIFLECIMRGKPEWRGCQKLNETINSPPPIRRRTYHFNNISAHREYSASCYVQFPRCRSWLCVNLTVLCTHSTEFSLPSDRKLQPISLACELFLASRRTNKCRGQGPLHSKVFLWTHRNTHNQPGALSGSLKFSVNSSRLR